MKQNGAKIKQKDKECRWVFFFFTSWVYEVSQFCVEEISVKDLCHLIIAR